jgi:hypothetical protein
VEKGVECLHEDVIGRSAIAFHIGRIMTIAEITGEGGNASPVIGDTVLLQQLSLRCLLPQLQELAAFSMSFATSIGLET